MVAEKGQRLVLEPNPTEVIITLGWKAQEYVIDVDASISYNSGESINYIDYINVLSQDNDVHYLGNIEMVNDEYQQESFKVLLEKINMNIQKLTITMKIYEAKKRNQSFCDIKDTFICINDAISKEELIRFSFQGRGTEILVGELYPYEGNWKFRAMGQ